MAYERVHTVEEYYDGPRTGVANYRGAPHAYRCEWSEADDEYANTFELRPIDEDTLALVLELWNVWRAWEASFHRGEVGADTHPAVPNQNPQFAALDAQVAERVRSIAASRRVRAVFRVIPGQSSLPAGKMRTLEVEWEDAV
jgi:hypothetical protein